MRSRVSPRFSANELAKYLTASASQRRRLIHQQKEPKEFRTLNYTPATVVVADYLSGAMSNDALIEQAINDFEMAPSASSWEQQRNQLCVQALKAVLHAKPDLDISDVEIIAMPLNTQKYLRIGDVDVSIRPENLIHGIRRGKPICGLIKQYTSKRHPLSPEEAAYLGALAYHYASKNLSEIGQACSRICYVYDVFAGKVWSAPRAINRRLKDIEAAADEIARAWNDVDV
jgi:hypothetical protein